MKMVSAISTLTLLFLSISAVTSDTAFHCAKGQSGIIGLAADDHYHIKTGYQAHPHEDLQEYWVKRENNDGPCQNSFTGTYMQVLPDDSEDYSSHSHINSTDNFTSMTGLNFKLRITEPGVHSLFVRWTAGDTIGGGDSMYVVLYDAEWKVVTGVPTYKEAVVGILSTPGEYAGVCYDMSTHHLDCVATAPGIDPEHGPPDCAYWTDVNTAGSRYNSMCPAGHGRLDAVAAPRWYLFSGQAHAHTAEMNFDVEPWDATCQAEASGTSDSGYDFPQWQLAAGDYTLVFYPREDGTCLDAWYMTTPANSTAPNDLRLTWGDSTVQDCDEAHGGGDGGPDGETAARTGGGVDGGGAFGLFLLGGVLGAGAVVLGVHLRVRAEKKPLPWATLPRGATSSRAQTAPRLTTLASTDATQREHVTPYVAPIGGPISTGAVPPSGANAL